MARRIAPISVWSYVLGRGDRRVPGVDAAARTASGTGPAGCRRPSRGSPRSSASWPRRCGRARRPTSSGSWATCWPGWRRWPTSSTCRSTDAAGALRRRLPPVRERAVHLLITAATTDRAAVRAERRADPGVAGGERAHPARVRRARGRDPACGSPTRARRPWTRRRGTSGRRWSASSPATSRCPTEAVAATLIDLAARALARHRERRRRPTGRPGAAPRGQGRAGALRAPGTRATCRGSRSAAWSRRAR